MFAVRQRWVLGAASICVILVAFNHGSARAANLRPFGRAFAPPTYIGTVSTLPINLPGEPFASPWGPIAFDSKRDAYDLAYYNSSNQNALIERMLPNGAITQIAVLPLVPTSMVYNPTDDKLYVTYATQCIVLSISQTGLVLPVAGGTCGTADGNGAAAQFQAPQGIAVDPVKGNLFVADSDRVRHITRAGQVITISPAGGFGPTFQNNFSATPERVAFNSASQMIFVDDPYQQKIWTISNKKTTYLSGQCIQFCEPLQRDGPLAFALFGEPDGAVFDSITGLLYVVEVQNNDVRVVGPSGVTTLAGSGPKGSANGVGPAAMFSAPSEATLNTKLNQLVVLDPGNNALRLVSVVGAPIPPPPHGITLYDPPTAASAPGSVALGNDGSVWFTETATNGIGRLFPDGSFAEYAGPTNNVLNGKIILGGDGNMWVSALGQGTNNIDRVANDGTVTEFPITQIDRSVPVDIVLASDGNIWFSNQFDGFGFMTPTGAVTFYPTFKGDFIADGLNGTFWLSSSGLVVQVSSAPALRRQLNLPVQPGNMVLGSDKNMWLAQPGSVAQITPGSLRAYILPLFNGNPRGVGDLASGADGAIWFSESYGGLGRLTTKGIFTDRLVPAARSAPTSVVAGPDGSIWFADPGSNKIGRYH